MKEIRAVSVQNILRATIRHADYFLSHIRLTQNLFIEDPKAITGSGIHTAGDWGRIRQLRSVSPEGGSDRYGSDADYRRYLAAIHADKILSAESLARAFDFGKYPRILELGCGDMPQACVVRSKFPDVSYTATDFDPYVIDKCAQLPLLRGIRKLVLDVTRDDLALLNDHDIALSWSLEFSLEDDQLTQLFATCRQYTVPYLLCTHTAIGPISYCSRAWAQRNLKKHAHAGGVRMLGWLRSIGEIARLARKGGMALRSKSHHVNHAALFFTPE